ncbi:hypothetical protein ADUPG1_008697 [Aduncisulcus paluster]|uniref:Metallo-beta-lactamase domain-containing protein n=1 Tax=Aduncisulcus paluster TaxID=2918883 RepID=A0ABQ5KX10_9EUKA|nr:hypothetical protein ADUPG1_008697 [Aduncisulcus paluster]
MVYVHPSDDILVECFYWDMIHHEFKLYSPQSHFNPSSDPGIFRIDTGLFGRASTAIYIISSEEGLGLVDSSGTPWAKPVLDAIEQILKRSIADVRYLFVTHAHLDHCGGVGWLYNEIKAVQETEGIPIVKVVCHEAAAPHIIDPSNLIKSATKVYGKPLMEIMHGTVYPVDGKDVIPVGKDIKTIGDIQVINTPGHSFHHSAFLHVPSRMIFVGDLIGTNKENISIPFSFGHALADGMKFWPSLIVTSPTQFNAKFWLSTLDVILPKDGILEGVEIQGLIPTHWEPVIFISERLVDARRKKVDEEKEEESSGSVDLSPSEREEIQLIRTKQINFCRDLFIRQVSSFGSCIKDLVVLSPFAKSSSHKVARKITQDIFSDMCGEDISKRFLEVADGTVGIGASGLLYRAYRQRQRLSPLKKLARGGYFVFVKHWIFWLLFAIIVGILIGMNFEQDIQTPNYLQK